MSLTKGSVAKSVANWTLGELSRLLNAADVELDGPEIKVTPQHLAELLDLLEEKSITGTVAKDVFQESFQTGRSPAQVVQEQCLTQIFSGGMRWPRSLKR